MTVSIIEKILARGLRRVSLSRKVLGLEKGDMIVTRGIKRWETWTGERMDGVSWPGWKTNRGYTVTTWFKVMVHLVETHQSGCPGLHMPCSHLIEALPRHKNTLTKNEFYHFYSSFGCLTTMIFEKVHWEDN